MVWSNCGFSFSRLNAFDLDFLLDLDFPVLLDGLCVDNVGTELDEEEGVVGDRKFRIGPPPPETETLCPKGSSLGSGSVSLRTLEASFRGGRFR